MFKKQTWAEQAAQLLAEAQMRGTHEEMVRRRLGWEDWGSLLPELTQFARVEIRRRRWRGAKSGVLPEGFDANSVAAEVVLSTFKGEVRLAIGWTRERLMNELKRKACHQIRRLHKLEENRTLRSEWDILPRGKNGTLRSVFAGMMANSIDPWDNAHLPPTLRTQTEARIADALRGGDDGVERLFGCLRAGITKRRRIAARLGMSLAEVTNCRKRFHRKLDALGSAGCPRLVLEEWKTK